MTEAELVDRLAELVGIADGYHDIWGEHRPTPPATKRALLAAMGLPAEGAAALAAAVTEREQAPWQRALAPVYVIRDSEPLAVSVTAGAEATLDWRLIAESGAVREGRAAAGGLAELDRREIAGEMRVRRELALPDPGHGYHCLEVDTGEAAAAARVVRAPDACHTPPDLAEGGRTWGLATQLYGLTSARSWGMGDLTDLGDALEGCADLGGGVVGVNPLHALFPDQPERCAPYSPSSRLFWNVLYIDVEAVPELADSPAARRRIRARDFRRRLARAREAELVDYEAVAALKLAVLETLHRSFRRRHLRHDTERARAFRAFRAEQGEALRRHALFEALQEHFRRRDPSVGGWPDWPAAYRSPDSPAVASFARRHAARVELFEYLQFLADEQLAGADRRARDRGMPVGVYQDLAVSVDRAGAETWARQGLYAGGASVGAPPDDFNLQGQDWGLPPAIPEQLTARAYEPFAATLRANMRHAGALRIDHAMGLLRLFWVPAGRPASDGAYVHYPLHDLLGVMALESQRNRCLVIGEDLGTVPPEIPAAFEPAGVLSYRVLYFEQAGGARSPEDWPAQALASATTHDLPTLSGFWSGHDLALRAAAGLFDSPEQHREYVARREDERRLLLDTLRAAGLLPDDTDAPEGWPEAMPEALRRAVHRYLARTPCRIAMAQLEDAVGSVEQPNLPGTVTAHPNWRRRAPVAVAALAGDPRLRALAADMAGQGRS